MKYLSLFILLLLSGCVIRGNALLLDDFEGEVSSKTVDFGGGNGSTVQVRASVDNVQNGKQSLSIEYNSVAGGYMWVARGYALDVKGAAQWLKQPGDIAWGNFKGLSFHVLGEASNILVAFDIKDSKGEMFRYMFKDDKRAWSRIICPFKEFFSRSDWQPNNAEVNSVIDFPVMSFQLEVRTPAKGILYIDKVELVK